MLRISRLWGPALAGVALGAVGAAPAAGAGTVSLDRACYVATGIGKGATINVSGSGYTPGEQVFAQIPAPTGLLSFVEATVTAQGTFTATLPNVSPESIEPVAEKETMQIKGVLSGAILAQAPFELTNLAVKWNPPSARANKKVTFSFSGFTPGKTIYGHYLHKGKVVLTHSFGKATGACGVLKAKAEIYPGKARSSNYQTQFDNSRKYSKSTVPRVEAGVSILRF